MRGAHTPLGERIAIMLRTDCKYAWGNEWR